MFISPKLPELTITPLDEVIANLGVSQQTFSGFTNIFRTFFFLVILSAFLAKLAKTKLVVHTY